MRRLIGTLLATTLAILVIAKILSTQLTVAEDGSVTEEVYAGDAQRALISDLIKPGARFVPPAQAPSGPVRWVKLSLQVFDREDRYVIERNDFIPLASMVEVIDGRSVDFPTGSSVPLRLRPLPSIKPTFTAPDDAVRGAPVFIRETGGEPSSYRLLTVSDYYVEATRERLFFGLYFGVLIAVGVYHLLMFAVLGGVDFLSYGLYLGALVLQQLSRTHYYETLVPGLALDYGIVSALSFALFALAAYWLFRSFLSLPASQPRIDRTLRALTVIASVAAIATPFTPWLPLGAFIRAISMVAIVIVLYAGWKALRIGVRAARWFLVALGGLFLGVVAESVWTYFGKSLPAPLAWLQYGFEIGAVFQALILALGLADRIRDANEERDRTQRRAIQEMKTLNTAFARFVPQTFLELLGKTDVREVELGNEVQREMTILFSDIRSFTSLSEEMTPEDTFRFLNGYLSRTGPIVRQHRGLIDKYMGDGIMALFPEKPDDAVRAAITLQEAVVQHNLVRAQRDRKPIAVGVGLHTGTLMLGTIGESERMDGTVIADAVNLASRVESLTKLYGAKILITEATKEQLVAEASVPMRYLGRVAVKGKQMGIGIFEVIGEGNDDDHRLKCATADEFAEAVSAFTAGAFEDAVRRFDAVLAQHPTDRAAAYFRTRSGELAQSSEEWDGVDQMTVK